MNGLEGKTVGVQAGSTAQEILETSKRYYSMRVTPMEDNIALLNELQNGGFDAVFLDSVVAYYYISSNSSDFYVISGNLGEEEYAIGFRKDDQTLRDKVQELLNEMKRDGTLAENSVKWFGSDITTLK